MIFLDEHESRARLTTFTEGFETRDLRAAKVLLDELPQGQ
jgi:hypothetical protein